jgi:PEGA domain-containing protein
VTETNPLDYDSNRRQVLDAALAAASWVRARRSVWTQIPLEVARPRIIEPSPPAPKHEPDRAAAPTLPPAAPPAREWAQAIPHEDDFTAGSNIPLPNEDAAAGKTSRKPAFAAVRGVRVPLARVAALVAAAVIVLTVGATAKAYWWKGAATARKAVNAISTAAASHTAAQRPPVEAPKTTGRLELKSEPAGAQVVLDGKPRGVTPMTVEDLAPGSHAFELQSSEGSIRRTFVVKAGETAQLSESIFGGWVKVFAPFEVTVSDGPKVMRLEEGNQVMVSAGRHDLHLSNRRLGYDSVHHVEVKPGDTATISVPPPASKLTVTASAPSEVWIDGTRAGDTPLVAPTTVGTHEIVVRQSSGEERRSTVTVTVKPVAIEVDFSKPPVS